MIWIALLVELCLLAVTAAAADAPRRIRTSIRDTDLYRLRNHTKPMLAVAQDLGVVSDTRALPSLTMHFSMTAQQEQDLEQLLEQQQTRGSARFHKFLTPEEYATRFGPNPDDVAKVTEWLAQAGFANIQVARSRAFVSFKGTAGQARSAFHTFIHRYKWNGESHYANANDPELPAALRGMILGIRGLNDFNLRPRSVRQLQSRFTSNISGAHFLAPGDFAVIYDVLPLTRFENDGRGVKIGVVGQSNIQLSDIRAFRAASGLPPKDPTIIVYGEDPGLKDTGDQVESDLDVEWAGGVAPGADITFITATNVFDSILYAVDTQVAPILSISYGLCESSISQAESDTAASVFRQANAQGMTVITASGDSGAAGCDRAAPAQRGLSVDFPSSLPYVTGVGGTRFNEGSGFYWSGVNSDSGRSAEMYIPEISWNDSNNTAVGASGGGASIYNSKPAWQTGNGVPNDGARDVPDVALAASPVHDGYLICSNGSCVNGFRNVDSSLTVVGGTSAGAPAFAGIVALLVQTLGPLGNINPDLYALAASSLHGFHDITAGTNSIACQTGTLDCTSGQIGYSAGPGYDQVTGLGSVDADQLIRDWTNASGLTAASSKGPLTFVPVMPCRVADTRDAWGPFGGPAVSGGSIRAFYVPDSACNIPSSAVAYALNVTVVPDGQLEWLTIWPSGQARPFVSTLNSDGRIKANAAIVAAGRGGAVNVYATDPTHVILDISGYFVPAGSGSGLQFFPLAPCRIADTREALGSLGRPFLTGGHTRDFPVLTSNCNVPPTAQAYSLNFTVVPRSSLLYVTAWPAGQPQPLASILNAPTASITANAAIIPAGINGSISTYASSDTELVIDINGYFAPAASGGNNFYTVRPCRVEDTREFNAQPFSGYLTFFANGGLCSTPLLTAQAWVLNATVVPTGPIAYLTLWPYGPSMPWVSTLNADPNTVTSNMAIVPSTDGRISAYAAGVTHFIADAAGYFGP